MHREEAASGNDKILMRVPGLAVPRWMPQQKVPVSRLLEAGLVIIDKPAGITSHDVVDRVRRCVGHKRVGHAGTLDPEVTGVLPVGLGQATRVLHLLLKAGKTYDTRMRLHGEVEPEVLRTTLEALPGTIRQLPPVRSRVKRVERAREIYELHITELAGREVRFTVRCEAGTYIRKLCHDLGEQLGVGAHMAWLRRTEAGGFTLKGAITLEALAEACDRDRTQAFPAVASETLAEMLHPLEAALPDATALPRMWLDDGAVPRIAQGSPLYVPGVLAYTTNVTRDCELALQTMDGLLVALGEAELDASDLAEAKRGRAAKVRRVLWRAPD